MKKGIGKSGFTLIEVLVTVVVIGVLAAVVIPAVTAQVTAGDSARVISDLNDVRTAVENFDIAVRQFPGDVDDLVNQVGTSSTGSNADADLTGGVYLASTAWAGPYLESSLPTSVTSSTANVNVAAFNTGYAATINNRFLLCKITDTNTACNSSSPDYVTIEMNNLTQLQNASLNTLIDGPNESASSTSGKFRTFTSGTTAAYYFATPYK